MQSFTIPFRHHQLAAISNQNRNAPAIILIHGNSASTRAWEKQFNSFLSEKYHLIAFDILGFGDSGNSEDPENDYDITSMSQSLLQVIEHNQLEEYFIVGHSLGGHLMVQTLDMLKGCKGIISIGAPPISGIAEMENFYLQTAPVGVMFSNNFTEDALDEVVNNFFTDKSQVPDFFKDDFRRADGRSRQAIVAILHSPHFKNEVSVLNQHPAPKAFISGANERSINNQYYETLNFPNTWKQKVYAIPNAAHLPQWENADEVNQLIDQFVQEHI